MTKVKTIKQRVVEKIMKATPEQMGKKMVYVLPHKTILKISQTPDNATRRLRELAQAYGKTAIKRVEGKIVLETKFVEWLRKQTS